MNKALLIFAVILTTLATSGCGNRMWQDTKSKASSTYDYMFDTAPTARAYHETASIPLIEINHDAGDILYSNIKQSELSKYSPVYVKPFTNQNNPDDKAIFGKVMTEQVVDRLVQRGLLITTGNPSESEYNYPKGFDPTSYQTVNEKKMDKLPPRSAMLSGTYVIGDDYIYMSAKIIRLIDNVVVSGHNWTLPINDNVRQLLPQLKVDEGLEPTVRTRTD